MPECWLKPNRRPAVAGLVLAVVLLSLGLGGGGLSYRGGHVVWAFLFGMLTIGALFLLLRNVTALRRPRVTYQDGTLYLHDGSSPPPSVPIEAVEAFFLGSGPIRPDAEEGESPRAANVVIRIAEAATEFQAGNLAEPVGNWSDGYIVLRGPWCEPIGHDRLNEINRRLVEVHRSRRENAKDSTGVNA